MSSIILSIRPAIITLFLCSILFGFIYPFVSTIALQLLFFDKAQGSLIKDSNGNILGSALIGQEFTSDKYFWSRLSANSYDALSSGASNLSTNNPIFIDLVKQRLTNEKPIPIDLVTSSASGLDPHISIAAALYQIKRVALARNMNEDELKILVKKFITPRQFGILGEPVVNVLKLNLALDNKI